MPRIDETAYRQLKATPTDRELRDLYTPTLDERLLAQHHTTGKPALVAFLVLLKTFQHLGYAVPLTSPTRLSCRATPPPRKKGRIGADAPVPEIARKLRLRARPRD